MLLEDGGPEPSPGTELLHQVAARTRRILSVFFSVYGTLTPDSREKREEREGIFMGRKEAVRQHENKQFNSTFMPPHENSYFSVEPFFSFNFATAICTNWPP